MKSELYFFDISLIWCRFFFELSLFYCSISFKASFSSALTFFLFFSFNCRLFEFTIETSKKRATHSQTHQSHCEWNKNRTDRKCDAAFPTCKLIRELKRSSFLRARISGNKFLFSSSAIPSKPEFNIDLLFFSRKKIGVSFFSTYLIYSFFLYLRSPALPSFIRYHSSYDMCLYMLGEQ